MAHESFLNGRVALCCGDAIYFLRDQPDNRYDSVVTDPPYALVSISKRFGKEGSAPAQFGSDGRYARASAGFMGRKWDTGETAFAVEFWAEVLRVLKPGGHVVAFGGTRTYHRLACAIEDAGFEIRDQLQWIYGSGFPKSHDVSKGIDRAAGATREVISEGAAVKRMIPGADQNKDGWEKNNGREYVPTVTAAATSEAAEWAGWGTALKPACEPICLARKPLSENTIAANVLQHGTGAINVDGCRVATNDKLNSRDGYHTDGLHDGYKRPWMTDEKHDARSRIAIEKAEALGRWPANIIHDGSEEVLAAFPTESSVTGRRTDRSKSASVTGTQWLSDNHESQEHTDSGSAARYFYTAKADSDDRLGSKHPTVKPVDLMQWLVRLVTPKGGLVLDPFAGTGTTAEACFREGMSCALVERETEYQGCIRRRMRLVMAGPEERSRESIKAKNLPVDYGPLFGGTDEQRGGGADRFTEYSRTNDRPDRIEVVKE